MNNSAWLTGPRPNGQLGEWRLDQDEYLVGREAPAGWAVPTPRSSRPHALMTRSGSAYYLADLGSRNGTFVNGHPVGNEPQRFQDRDELVLGGSIAFRFHDPSETLEGPRLGRLKG